MNTKGYIAGRGLLLRHLDPEQREEFLARDRFFAVGNITGRRYMLTGRSVWGPRGGHYCLVVYDDLAQVPTEDAMLARKLLIESAEKLFLNRAISG